MTASQTLPRILIVDDLFGRSHAGRRNEERANLCGQYLLVDATDEEVASSESQSILDPTAEAVFFRGQKPLSSAIGDVVENDLEGTLRIVRQGWSECPSDKPAWAMVLLDLCFYTGRITPESNSRALGMPEGRDGDDDPQRYFGLQLLRSIHEEFPDLPVVILSSKSRKEVSREFSHRGAFGFLAREDVHSPEQLRRYLWMHGLIQDTENEVVGRTRSLLIALRAARRAAATSRNVLIRGERGTGKELLARYIHRQREDAATSPFVVVNSAALTAELFPSELFGIEKGIATGVEQRIGLIKNADRGDLFFDEISDMVPQAQAGILRVLEDRKIAPVGSKLSLPVEVRFLSATNLDIEPLAASGSFRSDLLDRMREAGTVILPPLRERKKDIPLLAERFVRDAEEAHSRALKRHIEPETLAMLEAYDWPGNVRELRSCIFSAVNNHPDVEYLVPAHLQFFLPGVNGSALRETAHLKGQVAQIQRDYGLAMARSLKSALGMKPIPRNGSARHVILSTVKLLTGQSRITFVEAADFILDIFRLVPDMIAPLKGDPILIQAYEAAKRLRPADRPGKRTVPP